VNNAWNEGFTAEVGIVGWAYFVVIDLDFGETPVTIGDIWNGEIVQRNESIYSIRVTAAYENPKIGLMAYPDLRSNRGQAPTPLITCSDNQFYEPYCPSITLKVRDVWPGGAHVQVNLDPWRPRAPLILQLDAAISAREVWNAELYGNEPGMVVLKLASYMTSNFGAILVERYIEGDDIYYPNFYNLSICGNTSAISPTVPRDKKSKTLMIAFQGSAALTIDEREELISELSRALGVPVSRILLLRDQKGSIKKIQIKRSAFTTRADDNSRVVVISITEPEQGMQAAPTAAELVQSLKGQLQDKESRVCDGMYCCALQRHCCLPSTCHQQNSSMPLAHRRHTSCKVNSCSRAQQAITSDLLIVHIAPIVILVLRVCMHHARPMPPVHRRVGSWLMSAVIESFAGYQTIGRQSGADLRRRYH